MAAFASICDAEQYLSADNATALATFFHPDFFR
jgi:hypothetical protein